MLCSKSKLRLVLVTVIAVGFEFNYENVVRTSEPNEVVGIELTLLGVVALPP
jgi:hypothetical protein